MGGMVSAFEWKEEKKYIPITFVSAVPHILLLLIRIIPCGSKGVILLCDDDRVAIAIACLWGKQAFFYVSVEFVPGNVENPKKEKETGHKGALAIA